MSELSDVAQPHVIDETSKICDVIFAPGGDTSHPLYRPDAARVLYEEFGLPCYDCEVAFHESTGQGLSYHRGLDLTVVLARLNALPRAAPPDTAGEPSQTDGA